MDQRYQQYRHDGEVALIDIRLDRVEQLFNSLDPSPFRLKDLDRDAEDYIVGATEEFGARKQLRLVIHLPRTDDGGDRAADIAEALHNYFEYRQQTVRRHLHATLRDGRLSLVIGLSFLTICVGLRQASLGLEVPFGNIAAEGFLICGWVAMWRPIDTFLYDWWPLYRRRRTFAKLSRIPVEIEWKHASSVPGT